MKTIRISEQVWNAIAKEGKFGETPDDVLRKVFRLSGHGKAAKEPRQRKTTQTMKTEVSGNRLLVRFVGGDSKEWPLPKRDDKPQLRLLHEQVARFIYDNGGTLGQRNAARKALTDNGYHVSK